MSVAAIRIPRVPRRSMFDVRFGFALLRDSRVPILAKLFALAIGLAATAIVEFFELPVEELLAMLVPFLGIFGDAVLDGAEIVAGPLLFAALLLPFLAPREIVELIHVERAGTADAPKSPIIDI